MGYATILANLGAGRYTIECDYGADFKTQAIDALTTINAQLDAKIAEAEVEQSDAEAEDQQRRNEESAAIDEIIAKQDAGGPASAIAINAFELLRQNLIASGKAVASARNKVDILKSQKAEAARLLAMWNNFTPTATKGAWCTDYTLAASGTVATIDVNGESDLTLIAPGGRAWTNADGVMTAREIQSPPQVYFNAAILPGWQKFRPTYRWGTLTAVNKDNDTGSVALADARSSAQRLSVNQGATLSNIPIVYMTCNAQPFAVGDRVIVEFTGQDWGSPRVIGFLDNPKECNVTQARYYTLGYYDNDFGNIYLINEQTKEIDETWDAVTAPTAVDPQKWLGWNDAVATYTRSDGVVTASITKIATYTVAPPFNANIYYQVAVTITSAPYWNGSLYIQDARANLIITRTMTNDSGGSAVDPPNLSGESFLIWTGIALAEYTANQILLDLIDAIPGAVSPEGPLYFPADAVVASENQSHSFTLSGSDNVYTVVGDADGTFPIAADRQITSVSQTYDIDYTPTSWSATYA